jgi:hypothetical protein
MNPTPKKGSIVTGGLLWRHPPLRYRVSDLPPGKLVMQIESALAELSAQAKAGRDNAKGEFERLMEALDSWYQSELRGRAKAGDKSFNHQSSIEKLLWIAGDASECLAWLAKNRSEDCARHAENRLTWPGLISVLKSIEDKSQALKNYLPLGRKKKHYHPKTVADSVFRVAEWVIQYLTDWDDWKAELCFTPFKWRDRDEYRKSVATFRQKIGPMTKGNWSKWKPVFERCITLFYGPSRERWKLIPDLPMPKKYCRKYGVLKPETYKDDLYIAIRVGVTDEWFKRFVATHSLTPAEKADWQKEVQRQAAAEPHPSIMDIPPDDTLKDIAARAKKSGGKWSRYKEAILCKCKNLLPA